MFPFDTIDPFIFLMALCVGLLYTYLTSPPPEVVIKFPTPENAGKVTYVDDAGVCYRYAAEPVSCPSDPGQVRDIPIQATSGA